jgi:hypothetical protein
MPGDEQASSYHPVAFRLPASLSASIEALCYRATSHAIRTATARRTRAERYLFVTTSGKNVSPFFKGVEKHVAAEGGTVIMPADKVPGKLAFVKSEYRRDLRIVTSFSDIRYFLE